MIADGALRPLGLALADEARTRRDWLGVGPIDLAPMTIVVVPDADEFARWSRGRVPRWGAGLTVPSRRLIVIRVDAGRPFSTLRHELAHLALHTRVPTRVPLWFAEGYAALAAGEHGRLNSLQLNLAVAVGRVPGLGELDAALRGSTADAGTGYALAASAVAEIARRHPTGELAPMIDRSAWYPSGPTCSRGKTVATVSSMRTVRAMSSEALAMIRAVSSSAAVDRVPA